MSEITTNHMAVAHLKILGFPLPKIRISLHKLTGISQPKVAEIVGTSRINVTHHMSGMSAIVMEAKSNDPWTSRARPSFMYLMYFMIIMAVPAGILAAFKPLFVQAIITGMKLWLEAIPGELYLLFGTGYLGYGTLRTIDKKQVLSAKPSALSGLAKLFK